MLRQIKYFQSVVRHNSFSEAAEECYISQSAISQQIQALERELGFALLERKNRRFNLTKAGKYFFRKSLVLVADYEQLCREASRIAHEDGMTLTIGYLRCYSGQEFYQALGDFSAQYPDVSVKIHNGNHEELYYLLRTNQVDMVFNDLRRACSDEYVNMILTDGRDFIEIASANPLADMDWVTPEELKNIPCILVSSPSQQETEQAYYQSVVGIQGEFLFANTMEEARLLVAGGQGFMPVEGIREPGEFSSAITRLPLYRGEEQITRRYGAFWKKNSENEYAETFAWILKSKFI